MKVFGCSWKSDPCNQYMNIDECLKHEECTHGMLEGPPDNPVGAQVNFGDGKGGYEVQPVLNPPSNERPMEVYACKGKNYTPCYIQCSIF